MRKRSLRLMILLIVAGLLSWGSWGSSNGDDHGNTPLVATPIPADGTLVSGCTESPGDVDYFLFSAAGGRRYIIQTSHLTPEMDTIVYLFNTDGRSILAVDDNSGGSRASRIEWDFPTSGTYFVMVRHAQATSGIGCYELAISAVQADDHGDDPVTATPISAGGTPITGYIEASGDVDFFLFAADGGWEYIIETGNLTAEMDTMVELYDTDGRTILAADEDSGGGEASKILWTAPVSGTYFVAVRHVRPEGTGGYELLLERVGYGDDHGNEPATATPIKTDGRPVSGRIEVPGDVDLFSFSTRAEAQYTIVTDNLSPEMDTVLTLFAGDGRAILAEDEDSGKGQASRIEWTALDSGTCFVAVSHSQPGGTGSYELKVSTVLQLQEVSYFSSSGYALDVWVEGEYAYLVVGVFGLIILDISDPANPLEVGSHSTRGYARSIEVRGKYAYRADRGGGLVILDISSPTRPEEVSSYDTPGSAQDVVVERGYAYVADNQSGLQIIDVSNPSSPQGVGSWTTRGYAEAVHHTDGYVYIAAGDAGLEIVDVSDPRNPLGVGKIDLSGEAHAVRVFGDYAYVASGYRGVQVINVSDPTAPVLAGSYRTQGEASGLFLSGSNLYVADYGAGLSVLNLAQPASPQPVAEINTPGSAVNVFVAGEYAYVADREGGLRIIQLFP